MLLSNSALMLPNVVEMFRNLPILQQLFLPSNQIQRIEGLDNLTNLQILYVSSNQIQRIEGLDNLTNLQRFDLHEL